MNIFGVQKDDKALGKAAQPSDTGIKGTTRGLSGVFYLW